MCQITKRLSAFGKDVFFLSESSVTAKCLSSLSPALLLSAPIAHANIIYNYCLLTGLQSCPRSYRGKRCGTPAVSAMNEADNQVATPISSAVRRRGGRSSSIPPSMRSIIILPMPRGKFQSFKKTCATSSLSDKTDTPPLAVGYLATSLRHVMRCRLELHDGSAHIQLTSSGADHRDLGARLLCIVRLIAFVHYAVDIGDGAHVVAPRRHALGYRHGGRRRTRGTHT